MFAIYYYALVSYKSFSGGALVQKLMVSLLVCLLTGVVFKLIHHGLDIVQVAVVKPLLDIGRDNELVVVKKELVTRVNIPGSPKNKAIFAVGTCHRIGVLGRVIDVSRMRGHDGVNILGVLASNSTVG